MLPRKALRILLLSSIILAITILVVGSLDAFKHRSPPVYFAPGHEGEVLYGQRWGRPLERGAAESD